ncbi:MAG: 50S ribosomal protein L15 [Candidatus Eremiobacteraeota bacterium]|nr:50S ribosomal protein L15 [Candidatus Eremiobacteraeota bacterium]MBC5802566.1 50S ribosomal protein L15 [Candidatus Eremiobacteraeota bacterium]MBC5821861.1 50S ribosomal protein L15 [Candidatus Eremiobacteraeota bacterium]
MSRKKPAPAAVKAPPAQHVARGDGLAASTPGTTLGSLRENAGARPKRTRVGRGHGSGMVKTGGEGGKGQTVRSGGGKGPAFEGGQTPWARRLPHKRGYSQKARDIGHFRTTYAVVNLAALADWDAAVEVSPESLIAKRLLSKAPDGIKILGGNKGGKTLPSGLRFRDVVFSASAREALTAAGADLGDDEGATTPASGSPA